MKKLYIILVVLVLLFSAAPVGAQEVTLQKLYLVPVEQVGSARGPEYFVWKYDINPPSINCRWNAMDYGFTPYMLLAAHDITQADHDALILNADVYAFPDNLDAPIADPNIDVFFEAINIPTDWLTPSTSYRELLRNAAGIFQFNQRYGGIYAERYGGSHSIFDNATLSTRLRQMTAQEQEIFLLTVASFGFDPAIINTNSQLRLLVRQAASYWQSLTFTLGEFEF